MTQRSAHKCWLSTITFGLLVVFILGKTNHRLLVWNRSPSLPPGIYLRISSAPDMENLVEIEVPATARDYALRRWGSMPERIRFLKPVVAMPGDHVDASGDVLLVNGRPLGPIQTYDSTGVELPRWGESRALTDDEFFVFSDRVPQSFDSRYFGPIKRKQILAVRRPLITW